MSLTLWVLLGLGFLVGVGLVVYNAFFVEEEEEEEEGYEGGETLTMEGKKDDLATTLATTAEDGFKGARKSRMLALRESLEASLEVRQGPESASAKDRMTMPWFLLVGGEASGKTTLLANTGLALPYGPAFEVDSRKKDAGRWWLYEDAVVLEAPNPSVATSADTTLAPDQTQSVNTSEGWNTLLHMLRTERPDSPLNGIIVTVSAIDLIASKVEPDKLRQQAERIRTFLERTKRVLGVRLPLHVLVTKCDTLPGFKSFADNLPQERRHDIFGWANPNKLDMGFNSDWIDLGIAGLRQQMETLRDELLAAPEEVVDPDGLFVIVSEFSEVQEPLKEFVSALIGEGEPRRPSLFFRGMYFCGDAIEAVSPTELADAKTSGARATVQLSSEAAIGDGKSGHNLVFLRALFRDRIFKEAGLARPMARMRLSRDRRVVVAQAASVVFLLGGGFGLWTALNGYRSGNVVRTGLRQDAEEVSAVLAGMAIDLDEVKRGAGGPDTSVDRRLRDAAVIELVAEMRDVESIRKSPFIPASWFSPLPNEVRRSMIAGIESIVLPVSRQRLQERVDRLLGTRDRGPDSTALTAYATGDPRSLTEYLNEVKALSRNIARYNTLATRDSGTVTQLADLLEYLFGERPLEKDSSFTSADFQWALREASAPRIVVAPSMARSVVGRSVGLVASVARSAGEQLAPRTTPASQRALRPEDDLLALRGLGALVMLSDKDSGLVKSVSDSAILGMKLARIVEDSVGAELRLVALRIGRDTTSPAASEARLRDVIRRLFQLRFMERSTQRSVSGEIQPNQRLRWDVGRLELALSLRGEFDQALITVASIFPGQTPDRMRRAFQVQLKARAVDVAASAQRFTTLVAVDSGMEVRGSVGNLDLATSRIRRAANLLDSLESGAEGRKLITAATRQAEQALAMTQAMYERGRFLEPVADSMARWVGVLPISYRALGTTGDLDFEAALVRQISGIGTLSHDVKPALTFLHSPNADSTRLPALVKTWDDIGTAIDKWERGDATSTLNILHRFIKQEMNVTDPDRCAQVIASRDTVSGSDDVFMRRRRQFRAAMAARCGNAGVDAANAYEKLRSTFTSRLAGRYPFVDSARAAVASEADPAAVRQFLEQFDEFVDAGHVYALRADARLAGPATAASAFIAQMRAVRAFLSPLADNPQRAPEYTLTIGEGDLQRLERWIYGQPVVLETTQEDSLGLLAELTVAGGWSAIKATGAGANYERVRVFHPATGRELLPPVFPAIAPGIAGISPAPAAARPAAASSQPPAAKRPAASQTKTKAGQTGTKTKAATPRNRTKRP